MKSNKKALLIIIGLLLLFSIPQKALAAGGNSYNIKKIDITLTIPSNLIVFTQDTSPNDPRFSDFGIDGYSIIQSIKTQTYI